jgi:hypothetical protein
MECDHISLIFIKEGKYDTNLFKIFVFRLRNYETEESVFESHEKQEVLPSSLRPNMRPNFPLLEYLRLVYPIPVAALSKAWVYGRSLTGIVGSNPA